MRRIFYSISLNLVQGRGGKKDESSIDRSLLTPHPDPTAIKGKK